MKKTFILLAFSLLSLNLIGQTNKVTIRGSLVDTLNNPLEFCSVLLLTPADSSLVTYALSDDKGNFEFKNIKRQPLLVKATFVGLLPYQEEVILNETSEVLLSPITLKPISKELYEVVVKTAKAPISIKGDTIEYDASKFKVPPGSSVEDLLRKLPGVQIDKDGGIMAQGQTVQKVTVDGKRFFGGDAKMATKNLQADVIKKVQIFDDSSEQSKLTGIDDGNKEKTVNLELKEEAKKGGFGKITAGIGTDNRAMASGNYNKFDSNNQFSVIGFGNNLNQSGLSWDDYQDFKGSNSFRWSDEADFGFNNNSGNYYFTSSNNADSFSIPIGGNQGDGFSENGAGGINYNYTKKKKEISANYFYNRTNQTLDATQNKNNFLTNGQEYLSTDHSLQQNNTGNNRVSLRFKDELDSLNAITYVGNGRFNNINSKSSSNQEFYREGDLSNNSDIDNSSLRTSYATSNTLIYRRKFKKKGRNFAVSANHQLSSYDTDAIQQSINEFFNSTDANSVINSIYLANANLSNSTTIKGSAMYLEPFAKKFYWESFINVSKTDNNQDRSVYDTITESPNTNLSGYFENTNLYNRIGTGIRYSFKGLNISAAVARVSNGISADFYEAKDGATRGTINKTYENYTPNFDLNYSMKNNRNLGISMNQGVRIPSISKLSPIIENANPLYITQGNPNLRPEQRQEYRLYFHTYNPGTFTNSYSSISYRSYKDQIVFAQNIDPETLITHTMPENISGGNSLNGNFGFGFPIVKTKATLRLGLNAGLSKNLSRINEVLNETKNNNYNIGVRLSLTPTDWFTFYASTEYGVGNTSYSINTNQNQKIINNEHSGEMNIKLPKSIFWSTKFNYTIYKNDRFGFNQNLPILNSSLYKLIGKNKKLEARISGFDLLKRNLGIRQIASSNYVSVTNTQTLSRYFMFSLTYNMRGVSGDIKKRRF